MDSPLSHIARKEFVELVRDGRFRWCATILALLVLVSVAAGYTTSQAARMDRDAAQSEMQAWWYNQPAKNAHRAAHYGMWAFKPTPVLSFADPGVDAYAGSAVWLEAHKQNDFRSRPAMDATAAQRFGQWSAAAVLQQLVPLLVVILAFDAFAGEREIGTLRQLASAGVSPRALIAGKALGITGALSIVLVPAAALGSAAILMGGATPSADFARFTLLTALYVTWFAVVLAASLLVSLVAGTGRQALLVLLGCWTFNGVVAPRVATGLAQHLHATPSRVEFLNAIDQGLAIGLDGHSPGGVRAEALERKLLAEYHVATRVELPISFQAAAMQASEEHGNEVFDANYGRLYRLFESQLRVQQWVSLVAPLVGIRLLSMSIAGTDVSQHHAFATAAEDYRRTIARTMNGWLEHHTKDGEAMLSIADTSLWATVPPFQYAPPPIRHTLPFYAPTALLLGLWLAALTGSLATRARLRVL